MTSATLRRILLVALAAGTTACAGRSIGPFGTVYDDTREPTRAESKQRELEEAMRRARAAVPARPDLVQPGSTEATKVWKAALNGSYSIAWDELLLTMTSRRSTPMLQQRAPCRSPQRAARFPQGSVPRRAELGAAAEAP